MADDSRKKAKSLAKAFKKMSKPASKGGTGGTFKTAATKAGYADSTEGRKKFANHVLSNKDDFSPKMVKKANFYKNIIAN